MQCQEGETLPFADHSAPAEPTSLLVLTSLPRPPQWFGVDVVGMLWGGMGLLVMWERGCCAGWDPSALMLRIHLPPQLPAAHWVYADLWGDHRRARHDSAQSWSHPESLWRYRWPELISGSDLRQEILTPTKLPGALQCYPQNSPGALQHYYPNPKELLCGPFTGLLQVGCNFRYLHWWSKPITGPKIIFCHAHPFFSAADVFPWNTLNGEVLEVHQPFQRSWI